ncbi:MAG TPA: pyridoxal-phosphate dependent enzyme, partial [Gemmatimonadales bacterium]|nr:pyridoxal-phosphate dependent enzyme [Gemmatimonadales bacterium]
MSSHPTLGDVEEARERISGLVRHTPLLRTATLAAPVSLKLESLQETGSFKLRGAANRLLTLEGEQRSAGVVAVSSGNHGRAVAKVAADLGIEATVCLSSRVPGVKAEAIAALGARVVVAGPDQDDADTEARRLVEAEGLTLVHPFDDPMVIAGQGTVALEILEDDPRVDTVIVPLSGGGLIGGIAAALKGTDPSIRVIGVSQDRGPAMYLSIRAGHLVDVVEEDTLADALAGGLGPENRHTLDMCRDLVDDTVLVSEEEIAGAMAALFRRDRLMVEGGGAVGLAALLAGKVAPTASTVVVVSGGNVAHET